MNIILCGIARAAIKTLPLSRLSRYFGTFYRTIAVSQLLDRQETQRAKQIGHYTRLAAKYTPWDSSCLTQAMVAKFWCSLYKIPYAFYIGFAKSGDAKTGFLAHAWVTAGAIALTGGHAFPEFKIISSYFSPYALPGSLDKP